MRLVPLFPFNLSNCVLDGHIAEALNLPIGELPSRLIEINVLKDKPVILVCRTDKCSANAAALLRDAGFQNLRVLLHHRGKRPRQ